MSFPASLPASLPAAILQTILTRLAALFLIGADNDPTTARQAAAETLEAYNPRTTTELRLAANIIAFSFQALEALSQAATPDMPLTRILRLRGSAVSLSRESAKSERRLTQLQSGRDKALQTTSAEHQPPQKIERAIALIQETASIGIAAKATKLTWTQAHQQRQRDIRLAARQQRAQAHAPAPAAIHPPANHPIAPTTRSADSEGIAA